MIGYTIEASWVLVAAFTVSALYELFRSTAKADTSTYDSTRRLLTQGTPFYAIGFGLAVLVRTGWPRATWTGLLVAVALIGTVALSRNVPGKPSKGEALLHGRAPRKGRTTRPYP